MWCEEAVTAVTDGADGTRFGRDSEEVRETGRGRVAGVTESDSASSLQEKKHNMNKQSTTK